MKKLIIKYPLFIIVLLATVLRLPLLGGSFWMDEAAQALEIIRPFNQQLDIIADFQPPLLHFILHFAQYFSQSEWFLRTIGALIPGLITIIYSYKIAEKLFSKKVAIVSGLLLATSSFHIYFSQELRPYSLPTAFAIISMFYFIQVNNKNNNFNKLKTNSKSRLKLPKFSFLNFSNKKSINKLNDNLIFLTIFNTLGLYSTYLYLFFMLAQITYSIFRFKLKKSKQLLVSFGFSILAFLPLLPIFFKQLQEGSNVRKLLPGWDQVVSIPQLKALPLVFGKFIFGLLPLDTNPIIMVLTLLIGVSGILVFYKSLTNSKNIKKQNLLLLVFWLVVPLFSAWIVSFVVPVIRPKRLLFLLPGFYILISYLGLNINLKKQKNKKHSLGMHLKPLTVNLRKIYQNKININSGTIFLTLLFFINIFGTVSYYLNPDLQREDWRSLNTQLHKNFNPTETLLIYSFPNEFAPMRWYELQNELQQKETFDSYSTKYLYIENVPDLSNDIKIAASYKTVIVFDYLRDLTDPTKKIEVQLAQLGFTEVGVLDYPNIGFTRIFAVPLSVIGLK